MILERLDGMVAEALGKLGLPAEEATRVVAAADARHGDYQWNGAMGLAKAAGENPRALGERVSGVLETGGLAEVEVAGPGFVNFRVSPGAWGEVVEEVLFGERLGAPLAAERRRVVLDFSAPNVAKPMHVGHIRSTIIGDCLARVARFLGHEVVTDNHVGDWGTQFGMVIWAWKRELDEGALAEDPLGELLRLYRLAHAACKGEESGEAVKEECRAELVRLQGGDAGNRAIWERCVELSKEGLMKIYDRLGVSFDEWLGESFYHDRLEALAGEMEAGGLARESDGALCVFSDGTREPGDDPFKIQKDGEWQDHPMMVRKSDGGFNYATTDIATIDYRMERWGAEEIWYVVDARQGLHFRQLFEVARRRGVGAGLEHVSFGTILGRDRKPLKTRDGDLPQLADVLAEAVAKSREVLEEKSGRLPEEEKERLAEMIGIGSVKFTELSHHRTSDYVFDLGKMVALEGDTAPYLQYSYVRTRSIFRKLEGGAPDFSAVKVTLSEEAERNLARMLGRFGETVPVVLDGFRPNLLAGYLIDLARAFHSFFEACPVLKAEGAARDSRLALCEATARVLRKGMGLLGIEAPERM